MTQARVLELFNKTNALLEGHFKLSSGLHSRQYLQCALVLQHPECAQKLCNELAARFKKEKPTVVIGPAIGGIVVAYQVAAALKCRSVFTEREDGKMTLRRGFVLSPSDKAIVVEDVVTTGGSTMEVIEVVRNSGAALAGVAAIIDRSGKEPDFGVRFERLARLEAETFEEKNCPLCKKGIPVVKPGSRK